MASLNPTDGHMVAGAVIDQHRFLGRVRVTQLFQIAPDPRDTEDRKKVDVSKELQDLRAIRQEVQRLFEGAKEKNVPAYANYIIDVHRGKDGTTPPIMLYSRESLQIDVDDRGVGYIQIPWDKRLVAIDGETQLAARFEAANKDTETRNDFVPVYISHGKDHAWARQCFYDLNVLAVRPNAALSINMDARDPLTKVTREVERRVPFFTNRVNKVRRQLRKGDKEVVTISTLRGACITLAEGIGGVKYGSRPVAIDEDRLPAITDAAVSWLRGVTDLIGPAIEDQKRTLAAAPAVFAAIGAMGFGILNLTGDERTTKQRQLLDRLRDVDWARDKHWEGIAGKFTPKGVLSIGGSKETAYAIYAALNDDKSEAYARVRKNLVP